ncbi:MAG TPA: DUF433 domain-containing protein [Blastocatellia bacterium]|nr:DUF433 domain-containing protein [Blastocatellia bacterium]
MTAILETHIELDEQGRPWITGANTKVIEVVLDHLCYGWSPEEMQAEHPHLSLAQIHSALAYYYDHKEEIDRAIAEMENRVDARADLAKDSPGRRKLRELGLL